MSSLLVTAPWLVPISQPPLRDGAVLVQGDRIAAVGSASELAARYPDIAVERFSTGVMCPGLVNAHTHLTLTALQGVVPPQPFEQWLPKLVAALKPWEIADHEASGVVGAEQCLLAGVTVVGDIAYGAAEVAQASAAGLGGVFYWELLGLHAEQVEEHLAYLRYPDRAEAFGPRVVCGMSPHSPYTSGPALLQAVHRTATSKGVPTAIHVAESGAEVELMLGGTGALSGVAARAAHGFIAPHASTTRYLADLGVLDGATAVHLCHADQADIEVLARHVRGVVTCPRSNRYLDNPPPSIEPFTRAGIAVGVGTDSSASNSDLDLMAEVRSLAQAEPCVPPHELMAIATMGGARAIGVHDRFGALSPGLLADVAVFSVEAGEDPVGALLRGAGSSTVNAVMSSGQWRVRDGLLVNSDTAAAARAQLARDRSLEALAGDF